MSRTSLRILEHPQFANGTIDTGFLDREGAALIDADDEVPEHVRAVANSHQSSVVRSISPQSLVVSPEPPGRIEDGIRGDRKAGRQRRAIRSTSTERPRRSTRPAPPHDRWVFWNGRVFRGDFRKDASPRARSHGSTALRTLTAPMPATIVTVHVKAGDAVTEGSSADAARSDEDGAADPAHRATPSSSAVHGKVASWCRPTRRSSSSRS